MRNTAAELYNEYHIHTINHENTLYKFNQVIIKMEVIINNIKLVIITVPATCNFDLPKKVFFFKKRCFNISY